LLPVTIKILMPTTTSLIGRLLQLRPYEVDLLRERRRTPLFSWALCAAGIAALGGAILVTAPLLERQSRLQQELAGVEAELGKAQASITSSKTGLRKGTATRSAEATVANDAAAIQTELRRPWSGLFDQLGAGLAQEGNTVHIVQLGVDARFETLQLVAEGRELDKLVRFAQHVSGTGPIRSLTMTHHEWRDALGAHVVSATLIGQLTAEPLAPGSVTP